MEPGTWYDGRIDTSKAAIARIYDYMLGGSHNFPADRQAAEKLLELMPWARSMALSNRAYMVRVVRWLVGRGIDQFLDLGSGVPTVHNVHEVAQERNAAARVVYVDNDPVAVAHSELVLADNPNAMIVPADLRAPAEVQTDPRLRSTLDLNRPVAILMIAVLPFVTPPYDVNELVDAYLAEVVPGSYLAISHASLDGASDATLARAAEAGRLYASCVSPAMPRSLAEVTSLFDGLELVDPGVLPIHEWPSANHDEDPPTMTSYGGVGRLP
jgi:hypothetical protein